MTMQLRPYQREAVEAVYAHLRTRRDNPCVVLPTASGKSLVLGKIASDAVTLWSGRVLVLAHVKELLEQNAGKIRALCPGLRVGVYSAGLNRRDTSESVIVAGIQSVHRRACELGRFDLVIIDECHLIPPDGDGMYREFLQDMKVINPNIRLIGLTATPYRLKGGMICKPENLLNHVCYEAGIREMIANGYISRVVSRAGRYEADLSKLHVRGGEFVDSEVEKAMNDDRLVEAACSEIVRLTEDRKAVLIFASGIDHCKNIARRIGELTGRECAVVTGSTPAGERAEILDRFKGNRGLPNLFGEAPEPLKYVANVGVLTTGTDVPRIDCVVLLRPTNSPGLLVQMIGRGFRLSPGKEDCLVLDYGGNILRHGPIDMIKVREGGAGTGEAPAKKCPKCYGLVHAAYQICPLCGFVFPPPESKSKLSGTASTEQVLSETTYTEYEVQAVDYSVHQKRGAGDFDPLTVRIDYRLSLGNTVSEWICPEHSGYAREKFVRWWNTHAPGCPEPPRNAEEVVDLAQGGLFLEPERITVRHTTGDRFDRITAYVFKPREEPRAAELEEADLPF